MARYTGARLRLSRRVGTALGMTGVRSEETKCRKIELAPGMHGAKRTRQSEYALMLLEKQKLRWFYGLLEKQFKRFFGMAERQKGPTGENLILLLERRLDNVVFRMGFASTRAEARQLVNHRAILVNGQTVDIPSYLVKPDDLIEVREKSKGQLRIKAATEMAQQNGYADWVDVDPSLLKGTFKSVPERDDISMVVINENLIVEYYSR